MVGYDEVAEGECFVQTLDSLGRAGESYFWYDIAEEDLYGWLDGKDDPVESGTVVFKPGEAFWVKSPNADYSIQSAGQVPVSSISVALRSGFKMIANPTPIEIDINDISVTGYDEVAEGECFIQTLDSLGRAGESYFWYDIEEEDLYGWLDGKDDPIEEGIIMLEPGAGVWVKAPTANYSLVFPGVTLK